MKKVIFILLMCFITSFAFTQEVEIEVIETPDYEIDAEIDLSQFTKRANNNYWDKNGKGVIHIGIRMVKYEDMKSHMGKNDLGLIKIVEEKEISLNEISFLYFKQEQNRAGQMFEMISYVKKNDKNSILEIGAIYPKGEEDKYKNIVEKAAILAKVSK